MIIDAHVHLFPDKEIGKQIVEDFKRRYGAPYHSFGTPDEYLADMKRAGIDYGVILRRDLLKLYIYGYLNSILSSRKLETEPERNVELMWLLRKLKPDFKTIADFRQDNKEALRKRISSFQRCMQGLGIVRRDPGYRGWFQVQGK